MPNKPPRGDAAKASETLTPILVRLHKPGVHIDGSLGSLIHAAGDGVHHGFTITEDQVGIVLSKEGAPTTRIPWALVLSLEYSE